MPAIGVVNAIPWIANLPGQVSPTPTPPLGDFIITEASPLIGPLVEYVVSEAGDNLVKE